VTNVQKALDLLNAVAPAVESLACHQQQCDDDGVMVIVSRQAVDETVNAVNDAVIALSKPALSQPAQAPALPIGPVELKPITMNDIRLHAGEGKLRAQDVLAAANAVLRMRQSNLPQSLRGEPQAPPRSVQGGIPTEAELATAYNFLLEKPSTSYIQRKMGIGYNHACAIMETLENEGAISLPDANGKRVTLSRPHQQVTKEDQS